MSRTTNRDLENVARYRAMRDAAVPRWVTGHEAYRMTLGRVGEWGQTGGEGFSLAALCKGGEVYALSDPRVESFTQARVAGGAPRPAWVYIEREHGIPLAVGPYPDEKSAQHALTDALLIDGFAEEDAVDIFVVTDRPATDVEIVIIDPTNPDHTGVRAERENPR